MLLNLAEELHSMITNLALDDVFLDDENIGEGNVNILTNFEVSDKHSILNFLYTLWIDNPTRNDIQNIVYLISDEEINDENVYYTLEKLFRRPFFNPSYTTLTEIDEYMNTLPDSGTMLLSTTENENYDWVKIVRFMYDNIFNQNYFSRENCIQHFNNFIRCFNYYQLLLNSDLTQESILSTISTFTQDNNYFSEQFLDNPYSDNLYLELFNINNIFVIKNYQPVITNTYTITPELDIFIKDKVEVDLESRDYEYLSNTIIKLIAVLLNTDDTNTLYDIFEVDNLNDFVLSVYNLIVPQLINLQDIRYIDIILAIIDNHIFINDLFQTSFDNIRNLYAETYNNFIPEEIIPNPQENNIYQPEEIIYKRNGGEISVIQIDNPTCNVSNNFDIIEDKQYPLDPITFERIPRKRLVAVNMNNDKTQCYDANTLLKHWIEESRNRKEASDPITRLKYDRNSIDYVQNLLLNNLSLSDNEDYYYI